MKTIADICVIPIGVGTSLGSYVARCEQIFQEMGLEHRLHAYGTNVEGEWDTVMEALKRCHAEIHKMGAPRVSTTVRLGTRNDRAQSMQDKLDSVTSKLD
jgi:uncharacterized protein (TIGR00106 family)